MKKLLRNRAVKETWGLVIGSMALGSVAYGFVYIYLLAFGK